MAFNACRIRLLLCNSVTPLLTPQAGPLRDSFPFLPLLARPLGFYLPFQHLPHSSPPHMRQQPYPRITHGSRMDASPPPPPSLSPEASLSDYSDWVSQVMHLASLHLLIIALGAKLASRSAWRRAILGLRSDDPQRPRLRAEEGLRSARPAASALATLGMETTEGQEGDVPSGEPERSDKDPRQGGAGQESASTRTGESLGGGGGASSPVHRNLEACSSGLFSWGVHSGWFFLGWIPAEAPYPSRVASINFHHP